MPSAKQARRITETAKEKTDIVRSLRRSEAAAAEHAAELTREVQDKAQQLRECEAARAAASSDAREMALKAEVLAAQLDKQADERDGLAEALRRATHDLAVMARDPTEPGAVSDALLRAHAVELQRSLEASRQTAARQGLESSRISELLKVTDSLEDVTRALHETSIAETHARGLQLQAAQSEVHRHKIELEQSRAAQRAAEHERKALGVEMARQTLRLKSLELDVVEEAER